MKKCPCGTEKTYQTCCGKFIAGEMHAETPMELMRSRYTAYATGNMRYVIQTMKAPAADDFQEDAEAFSKASHRFVKLEVLNTALDQDHGIVEFQAYCIDDIDTDKIRVLHEISRFKRDQGIWYYIDGTFPRDPENNVIKMHRNDPCICGSGVKFKKCCRHRTPHDA